MKYKLEYWIVIIAKGILLCLPEKIRFKFAEFLAWVAYKVIKSRRITALLNLDLAFPEKSKEEKERIALESYKTMFKAFLTSLWFDKYVKEKTNMIGFDKIKEIKERGHGLAVALIHMGNMEASLKAAETYPIITVAKKQRNPYIDDMITKTREQMNVVILKKSKQTSRELLKYIEEKNVIALFSDHRDKGTQVKFFGRDAISPTGIINIALKHNLPLIVCYNIINPDNSCTTKFSEEIILERDGLFKENVRKNTQKMIEVMERIIRENPTQWMWFHDRWRLYDEYKKNRKNNK